jgi:glycosyltransferase involved in cell wall biosynthesis
VSELKATFDIVHLIPGLYLGGAEKVMELIARHQASSGHRVHIIAFERSGYENFFEGLNVHYCKVEYRDGLFSHAGLQIQEYESLIDRIRPDIVHSHSFWTDQISQYNNRPQVKYISHLHLCYDFFDPVPFTKWNSRSLISKFIDQNRLYRRYRKTNCAFIAASPFIYRFYSERFPHNVLTRMSVMPNPVDDDYFDISHSTKKYDLLSVGRLETVKNHKLLLEIVKGSMTNDKRLVLCIAGDGSLRNELQTEAIDNGLLENVIFLRAVKNLAEIFSQSDIYIHVSDAETFGLAIYEAMAAGLPVIVKKFQGFDPQIIGHLINAIVIDNADAQSFLDAIALLQRDSVLRDTLIKKGYETARRFSSSVYLQNMDNFYRRLNG